MNAIATHKKEVQALCRQHKVKTLYLFGSATTDRFGDNSDIDFLVEFKQLPVLERGDCYFLLLEGLQDLFKREIDLLTNTSIKNPFLKAAIDKQKVLLYA